MHLRLHGLNPFIILSFLRITYFLSFEISVNQTTFLNSKVQMQNESLLDVGKWKNFDPMSRGRFAKKYFSAGEWSKTSRPTILQPSYTGNA